MKPTAADFRFWEAYQARHVPSWARKIDATRTWHAKRYTGANSSHISEHLHAAINAHANPRKPYPFELDTRNAMSMLRGWSEQLRDRGYTYAGASDENPRSLRDSLRASLTRYGVDRARNPRGPTFARILRRLEKHK